MGARESAKSYLTHYFSYLAEECGCPLDGDSYSEIADIVDLIIEAAKEG